MAVDQAIRERIAADLWTAERTATAIGRPTDALPELDVVDAYEFQLINIRKRLEEAGLVVDRSLVGNYITSLEMQGCSVTVLVLDDELTALWDAPVHTPALRRGV